MLVLKEEVINYANVSIGIHTHTQKSYVILLNCQTDKVQSSSDASKMNICAF